MKFLLIMLSFSLLVSCSKSIKGTLNVTDEMDFNKKTKLGGQKDILIPVGEYASEIILAGKNKIKLNIRNVEGKDKKISFILPPGVEFPSYSGDLFLESSISGQPYDLNGKVRSQTTNSHEYSGVEGCSYTENRYVCRTICQIEFGQQVCRQVCDYMPITVQGRRHVSFYYKYTDILYTIDFLYEATQDQVAKFKAIDRNTFKHYTYRGRCY
ncbi:MAG: hypothetical protein A2381_15955 [Bdellovibrionales bacterium RIFOXYB1_FULL_37_110]|nr:MAG: hypothetical protein A2417_07805 [Bdellovibrionales bacterium RIFOXYC1_FULL_37_79]OFZ57108.1 MAG: hypothetical protein A2381_15955 [Bdellovibrionales bacterium RIFOXYB1_FULL_37_110]OFZ65408.1 MAG: hypothetical protein A2577_03915 [Bdellovibrionales bacterium RIFOXYD1_FULL_36_51]